MNYKCLYILFNGSGITDSIAEKYKELFFIQFQPNILNHL